MPLRAFSSFAKLVNRGGSSYSYTKSNEKLSVHFAPSPRAKEITRTLLSHIDTQVRQFLGEKLLIELASNAGIREVRLKVSGTHQWHKKKNGRTVFKQYGYYRGASNYIYIQNLTAVQGKPLAPKTFLDTLIHEWMHHYDKERLRIRSMHTKGFYLRLNNLKNQLLTSIS